VGALIALLPLFAGMVIMTAAAMGWIKYRQWRAKTLGLRFPLSQPLLRPAGYGLSVQMDDAFADLFGALIMGSFASMAILALHAMQTAWWHVPEAPVRIVISALGILFVLGFSIRRFIHRANKLRDLRLGWAGELATAEALSELLPLGYRVFHDLPAEGFNIDHVAIGPQGVFAIETKMRVKKAVPNGPDHKVVFNGKSLRFPAFETDEPLVQARNQARWLSNWLSKATGEPAQAIPVVSLPGWFVETVGFGEVIVLTPKQAVSAIAKRPPQSLLAAARIKQLAYQVESRCRTIDHSKRVI
jgi:hypothetical protein